MPTYPIKTGSVINAHTLISIVNSVIQTIPINMVNFTVRKAAVVYVPRDSVGHLLAHNSTPAFSDGPCYTADPNYLSSNTIFQIQDHNASSISDIIFICQCVNKRCLVYFSTFSIGNWLSFTIYLSVVYSFFRVVPCIFFV